MSKSELPVTGYLARLSARPDESVVAHISVAAGVRYRARLKRVISADPHPDGPGRRYEDLGHVFDRTFDGRRQPIALGSCARVVPAPRRSAGAPRTWTALVWTALAERDQVVIADEGEGAHALLSIGPTGTCLTLATTGGDIAVTAGTPLRARAWYRVWASVDPARGHAVVGQTPLAGGAAAIATATARAG